jgi:hypothetical protein
MIHTTRAKGGAGMLAPKAGLVATLVGLLLAVSPATAAGPGMTVKIPASQDVDSVYILAAVHQKGAKLSVSGKVMGKRMRGGTRSVVIHLTNQVYLKMSSSDKKAVKRAIHKGRRVTARVTIVARKGSGRSSVTRSVKLHD